MGERRGERVIWYDTKQSIVSRATKSYGQEKRFGESELEGNEWTWRAIKHKELDCDTTSLDVVSPLGYNKAKMHGYKSLHMVNNESDFDSYKVNRFRV